MTSRVQLGWWVYSPVWDIFVDHVQQKWGEEGPYVRFELESAMREYLDEDDDLAEAEDLLREHTDVQGLSSSSEVLVSDLDKSDKKKLGHRINPDLKDEFAKAAKKYSDHTCGVLLSYALRSYCDGGRKKRVLELVKNAVGSGTTAESDENAAGTSLSSDGSPGTTGTTSTADENRAASTLSSDEDAGTTADSDENAVAWESAGLSSPESDDEDADEVDSSEKQVGTTAESDESVIVDPMKVQEIGESLGDEFTVDDLKEAIRESVGQNEATLDKYSAAVVDNRNVVKHPNVNKLFIPETKRESLDVYGDMDREERAEFLKKVLVLDALKQKRMRKTTLVASRNRKDLSDLFAEKVADSQGPSHDYAYKLARDIDGDSGFTFKENESPKKLEVRLEDTGSSFNQEVLNKWDDVSKEDLTADAEVTSYTAGSPPTTEGAADDD